MKLSFEATVILTVENPPGSQSVAHSATDFNLEVSGPIDRSKYIDLEGFPTADGVKALSNVLVQGLVANIQMAHVEGFRDSAEHLRWIIAELERGFVAVADTRKANFGDKL